jgi:hypothetical protein
MSSINLLKPPNKSDGHLTVDDFISYPIWGFAADDGDEVMPVDYPGYLIAPNGGNGWFIACEFTLNDKTNLDGVINIRTTNRSLYVLKFPDPNRNFFAFPVNSRQEGRIGPEQLAEFLHKSIDQIFPIAYKTPFVFKDGQKIIGQYDLPSHLRLRTK